MGKQIRVMHEDRGNTQHIDIVFADEMKALEMVAFFADMFYIREASSQVV